MSSNNIPPPLSSKSSGSVPAIEVVPYDLQWASLFQEEAARIQQALGPNCVAIHHIGSTSVPELSAKPIIDIIPVVKDITQPLKQLEKLGYESKGEFGIPFRSYFQKRIGYKGYNVHIYEQGNPEIERHLKFRDWLRSSAKDRQLYAKLKKNLAKKFPYDIRSYSVGKSQFVTDIETKAGFDGKRMVIAFTDQEWEAYHRIHKKEISDPVGKKYDYSHPSLTADNHFHFVLYKGPTIVSMAHVEFLNEADAIVCALATESS